jgi:hypothetical protein
MRVALGRQVVVKRGAPIPPQQYWPEGLKLARKSGYGVFPERLNNEERAFAEFLDEDDTGVVKWWLRNPESEVWATRLLLPTGRRFFPISSLASRGVRQPTRPRLSKSKTTVQTDGCTAIATSTKFASAIADMGRSFGPIATTGHGSQRIIRRAFTGSFQKAGLRLPISSIRLHGVRLFARPQGDDNPAAPHFLATIGPPHSGIKCYHNTSFKSVNNARIIATPCPILLHDDPL